MAIAPKELGQLTPSATTLTDLYTVPGATSAFAVITVTNRSAVATTFRVSVAIAGAADDNKQYKAYDRDIGSNSIMELGPYGLAATDKIRVYATLATVTFTANGMEIT